MLGVHELKVHELEVQELEIQDRSSSSLTSGQVLEVQDIEVLKMKVQKLEPELWGKGAGGDFSGALRCPRVVEKVRVTLPSVEVRDREAFPFTPSSQ